jgi:hypothetical protein
MSMKPIVKSLAEYLASLGDSPYSVTGTTHQFRIAFPEGEALITADGNVKEHLRMPRASVEQVTITASGDFVSKVTENDYATLVPLLELSHNIILDYTSPFEPNDMGHYPNTIPLGVLDKFAPGAVSGVMSINAAVRDLHEWSAWKNSRITFSENENDETIVEVKYFPNRPYNLDEREAVFKKTRLSEVMTFAEFEAELDGNAKWLDDCFGRTDIYELTFEVVLAGDEPLGGNDELDYQPGVLLSEDPLWLTSDGEAYNIYIWEQQG